jgi:hypothetical protein
VVTPSSGDYQLVVMHKKRHGKFKNVFESSPGSATGAGVHVFSVPNPLPIHKGDYIGLKGGQVQGIDNPDANGLLFDPAVEFPDAAKPILSSPSEYQFNATLKH